MVRTRHLLRSSILVILFFGIGKLTGLVRLRLIGTAFGTSPDYDAFTAANQLPEVFYVLIAGGSLAAAFIPVYSDYLTSKAKESARLANTILTLVIVVLGSLAAVGAVLAPWLTRVALVPNFPPEMQQLTAELMRIILIQTVLFGISGVLSSILNAHQHFALPALAPLALDVGYIVGLYLFVPTLGIHGLAWGTVLAGLLHIGIQVPALVRYKISCRPAWGVRLAGTAEIIRLMGPRIVMLGAIQFADLFIIRLTSGLPSGSTSGYFYGYALMQLPETLFGTAIALVMFPTMAEMFNAGDLAGLKRTAVNALKIIWTLTIPAAAVLVILGEPAITVFLQGGVFDEAATRLVSAVLIALSIRLISEATLEIVARLFYARHNTSVPMRAYLGWLVVFWALANLLVGSLGVVGLAVASTIAFTLLSVVLFVLNWRDLGDLHGSELAISGGRAVAATVGMVLVMLGIGRLSLPPLYFLAAAGLAGTFAYLLLSHLLGGREIPHLWRLVRQRENQS